MMAIDLDELPDELPRREVGHLAPDGGPYPCACSLCFPDAEEYGELFPGYYLMRTGGRYILMQQPGHKDYEVAFFAVEPRPSPKDFRRHEAMEAFDQWIAAGNAIEFNLNLDPVGYHRLIKAACKATFRPTVSGSFKYWLNERAAQMIIQKTPYLVVARGAQLALLEARLGGEQI